MAAADIEIVHQPAVLDVEAVAGGSIAMGDQDALCATVGNLHMGLDDVAAAADIGRDIGRHVPHAGVKGELAARAVKTRGVFRKARAEAVVERQHVVLLGLAPPQLDHCIQPLGLLFREILRLRKVLREMKQLPFVVLERRARGMERTAFQPSRRARDGQTFEILRRRFEGAAGSVMEPAKLSPSIGIGQRHRFKGTRVDQIEQGRRQVAGVDELMAHSPWLLSLAMP